MNGLYTTNMDISNLELMAAFPDVNGDYVSCQYNKVNTHILTWLCISVFGQSPSNIIAFEPNDLPAIWPLPQAAINPYIRPGYHVIICKYNP